ncbi:MAG TPA: hypothetical protein VG273_12665 [Bryobacteraceae bacterium]|nr:hypothetical protein [Bryobacteraceae bacterium]
MAPTVGPPMVAILQIDQLRIAGVHAQRFLQVVAGRKCELLEISVGSGKLLRGNPRRGFELNG